MAIRCNNCGWDNIENEKVCIKCNTILIKNNPSVSPQQSSPIPQNTNFGGTIQGKQIDIDSNFQEERIDLQTIPDLPKNSEEKKSKIETIICPYPDCGFINISQRTTCIKCQRSFLISELKTEEENETQLLNLDLNRTTQAFSDDTTIEEKIENDLLDDNAAPVLFSGTIDPYRKKVNKIQNCYLSNVDKSDNSSSTEINPVSRKFSFIDEEVKLNRENIEPSNKTITSKTQAELSFENGKWYLLDKSEQQTTFIQVNKRTEITSGDIILMGDRKMIFLTEDDFIEKP
jgi:hypothetical protein